MPSEIRPGQPIASFALPITVTAFGVIGELIEAVYGTGEIMMAPDGDQLTITAPKDGFGPRPSLTERAAARPDKDDMEAHYMQLRDGTLTVEMADGTYVASVMSEMMRQWFDLVGGLNYVQMSVLSPRDETNETETDDEAEAKSEFLFTLQRRDGKTAHDLRLEAEARVTELTADVERLTAELSELRTADAPS